MSEQQQEGELGEAVKQALAARNLSVNAASTRLRIDRNTLTRFTQGVAPRVELVERFARGLGLDVNEWRERAGYERVESPASAAAHLNEERQTYRMLPQEEGEEESGRKILLEGLVTLGQKHKRPLAINLSEDDLAALTPEKARATLKFWDEQASAGTI